MHVKESQQNLWQCICHSYYYQHILKNLTASSSAATCSRYVGNIVWILLKIQFSLHEGKDFKNRLRIENKLLL